MLGAGVGAGKQKEQSAAGKTSSSHFGSGWAPLAGRAERAMKAGLPQAGLL